MREQRVCVKYLCPLLTQSKDEVTELTQTSVKGSQDNLGDLVAAEGWERVHKKHSGTTARRQKSRWPENGVGDCLYWVYLCWGRER